MAKSALHDEKLQEIILNNIREVGIEECNYIHPTDKTRVQWACYDGIVSRTAYANFKSAHSEFAAQVDDAKAYYRQQLAAASVAKREALLDALEIEAREGYKTTKVREKQGTDGNIIETVTETTRQPPREFLYRMFLPDVLK